LISPESEIEYLFRLQTRGIALGLDRVTKTLSLFGNPETRFPTLHVAGTNGKGSVAAMLHAVYKEAGYRTGLYTSPHLVSFCERFQVNGERILPGQAAVWIHEIRRCVESHGIELTFFEYATVLAFLYFADCKVDVGVIEVGMGGRLDATNVVRPVVSVVTTIAKDHEEFLGQTVKEIAREKAGIIKGGIPVVSGVQDLEARDVLETVSRAVSSPLYQLGRDFQVWEADEEKFDYRGPGWFLPGLTLGLKGIHQRRNAAVALMALELSESSLAISEGQVRSALCGVKWPGRFEMVRKNPLVIMDGAHNLEGVQALKEEILAHYAGWRVKTLFGVMRDKDWRPMLSEIEKISKEIILTEVKNERSERAGELRRSVSEFHSVRILPDASKALKELVAESGDSDLILVTGSLYLVGEVRAVVTEWR
jgi:dihydrofolate synthase/folylpolyglutamate synthase